MCRLLHFLANSANSRASLLLLSQDGHHCLGEQVSVLAVTHHLLRVKGDNRSTHAQ